MTVMALTLQALGPAQERQEQRKQARDERSVGQQQFDKQQHGVRTVRAAAVRR